jgi:hypothetical protein
MKTRIIQANMSSSNTSMNPLHRMTPLRESDGNISVGPGGPVTMDGEISVLRAKRGSREVEKNEIGVEFKIRLSGEELFEAVFMRKVGNGTVVLEVVSLSPTPLNNLPSFGDGACLRAGILSIYHLLPSLTFFTSFSFFCG